MQRYSLCPSSPVGADLMRVRAAVPGDIPAMRRLAVGSPEAAQWDSRAWEEVFTAGAAPRVALVSDENDGVLGFVMARALGSEWELENIVVAASVRRRGIARQLVQHLMERARTQEAEAIHLEVRASNQAARTLYADCGFTETGRREAYYAQPAEDAVLYKFSFSSPNK